MPNSPVSEGQAQEQAGQQAAPGQAAPEQAEDQQRFDALEDRYKRALADLDNYRKRSAKEADRRVTDARDAVVRDWLEIVDTLERALRALPDESLQAVLDQADSILERQGIARVSALGAPFDPALHDAVAVRETDEAPPQTVLDVARAGYRAGDRVLRPAEVVVARAPADTT
jgi:molecular chaperone GrpE